VTRVRQENKKWIREREPYYVLTGSMFDNPHGVPPAEVVRMIAENPPEVTAQTVFGKYVESSGLVFLGETVQKMIDRHWRPVVGNSWQDKDVVEQTILWRQHRGHWPMHFHAGIDVARKTDHTVISVLDCSSMPARLVYWKRLNRVPWETIYNEIGKVRAIFGTNILIDSTGPSGDTVMDALENRLYCIRHERCHLKGDGCPRCIADKREYRPGELWLPIPVEGYTFGPISKQLLVEHLRNVLSIGYDFQTPDVDFGYIRTPPIVQLEEELSFYAWVDTKLVTDSVFSLALAAWSGLEDPRGDSLIGSIHGD
jgi:hypothetical protein